MEIGDWRLFDRYPTLRRVIVNTKTDRAFRGVLWRKARGYLVLRDAEILKGKGETSPVDGEVVIESSNVDFMQVI
jgi:small nuclear ribonucleoprotein (snRNP)-like protein